MTDNTETERIEALEARVGALGAVLKTTLTTLMLRGLLTKAEIAPILAEAETLIGASPSGSAEIKSIEGELPDYMRKAMGPAPDDGDHDH